ncbi:sensor histidine kinase [Streptomyces sp. NPDC059816]|uniref:sensor histidine kinase n=1 Tax=Streptomyces sp. NPDC059816 TaxID=3346960 RepID=UPI00364717AD
MSTTPTSPQPSGHGPGPAPGRRSVVLVMDGLRHTGSLLTAPPERPRALLADSPRAWVRRLPPLVALALVAILLPVTAHLLTNHYAIGVGLAILLAVAQAGPLILAVTRPLRAWGIIAVADVTGAVAAIGSTESRPAPWTPTIIIGYLALCVALSQREGRRTLGAVWLATLAATAVLTEYNSPGSHSTSAVTIALSGGVLLLGTLVKERREAQHKLAEQETINEAERFQRTLLEERARIARELHDVVAHHMSVITVQADSAAYRLPDLSPETVREFESIAAGARESLGEMRRLLSVLRSEDAAGERVPQPGLDRLRQLADATVRAGVPVVLSLPEITLVKFLTRLSPVVELSAYRIVQEALANVVRHAPGARTEVLISTDGDHLTVVVVNRPAPRRAVPLELGSTGHGLRGMAERVRLVGGTLDVGPLPDGGFRVAARLPVAEPRGTTASPPEPSSTSAANPEEPCRTWPSA